MRPARRLAALLLAGALQCTFAAGDDVPSALRELRPLLGAQPAAARTRLAELRRRADAAGRLDWRLAVDEVDCRLLTDVDASQARVVADTALANAGADVTGAARLPWLRLRACRASVLLDTDDIAGGEAELAAIAAAASDEALQPARGLALLERGVGRSRRGLFVEAQEDLLAACEQLRRAPPEDLALCQGHLANHYRRIGEHDEALLLLEPLAQRAAAAGAVFDAAVHEQNIGHVRAERDQWDRALEHFDRALQLARSAGDRTGAAYALQGSGLALVYLDRAREAAQRLDESERILRSSGADPRQLMRTQVTRALAAARLGDLRAAREALDRLTPAVKAAQSDLLWSDFLRVRIEVAARQESWREAFELDRERDAVRSRLQEQRQSYRAALLRAQFNRERDMRELRALQDAQEQQATLRTTQAVVIALTALLLALTVAYAWRKWHHARAMQTLALVDELTGVSNRRAILAVAAAAFADAQRRDDPLSLLMIDVDHFKAVNDRHGHEVGDEVLRAVAATVQRELRRLDRLGRLGGEEFLVVLPGTPAERALAVAERIRAQIAQAAHPSAAGAVRCTVSIGVAGRAPDETAAAQTLARADQALYRAKEAGRDRVERAP